MNLTAVGIHEHSEQQTTEIHGEYSGDRQFKQSKYGELAHGASIHKEGLEAGFNRFSQVLVLM